MGDIPEPWPDDPRPPERLPLEAPLPHDPPPLPGQAVVEVPDIRPRPAAPAGRRTAGTDREAGSDVVAGSDSSDGTPSEPPD